MIILGVTDLLASEQLPILGISRDVVGGFKIKIYFDNNMLQKSLICYVF